MRSLTSRAVLCTAVAFGGISAFAAPSHATPPGDSPGVITAPIAAADGTLTYQSEAPDGTGNVHWAPDDGAKSPAGLAYSPDGTRIAFYSQYALWVARADGTQAHEIAGVGPWLFGGRPAWSADGTWVYFQDTTPWEHSRCQMVVDRVLANGAHAQPIISMPFAPVPGGCPSVVATLSTSVDGNLAVSLGGDNGVRIWHPSNGALTTLSTPGLIPEDADYSPDGKSLVFVGEKSRTNGTKYTDGVYVDDLATSALTEIVAYGGDPNGDPNLPGNAYHDFHSPVWAPDGSAVAYVDTLDNGQPAAANRLDVYRFATSTSTQLTDFHTPSIPLAWRPNTKPLQAPTGPTVDRLGGADRIATAVDASRFEFAAADATAPGARKATCAVLTRSDNYADALSGSALAGAKSCPLLLTPTDGLPGNVLDELKRVLPKGATVYILGGPDVMAPAIEGQVAAAGFTSHRLAGSDRYATSLAIAHEITAHPSLVLVATADNYPDALAAGAVASARTDAVVLTLPSGGMTPAAHAYLDSAMTADGTTELFAVGVPGYDSVASIYSQNQLSDWFGEGRYNSATGEDRYSTASQLVVAFGGRTHKTVALATGNGWADALAGGSVAGLNDGLLLLADGTAIPDTEFANLADPNDPVAEVLVFGGTDVVRPQAVATLESATGEKTWNYYENRLAPPLP